MKTRIFVYGTLRNGQGLNPHLNNFKFLGYAELDGYEMYSNGAFPMIVEGNGKVYGEVYEIENGENEIAILDRIEQGYTRKGEEVKMIISRAWIEIEVYVYNHDVTKLSRIKIGDWLGSAINCKK